MKALVPLILLFRASLLHGQDEPPELPPYSVARGLQNVLTWEMKGATLTFEQDGEDCHLKSGADVVHSWKKPLQVHGVVRSETGTALLVLVRRGIGRYHSLTRIVLGDGGWRTDDVLLATHQSIKIRGRMVRELGAVADDGKTAILFVGEADRDIEPETPGYNMRYSWQTWNLDETEKIGTGLKQRR
jgi:hypothetical protein